MLLNIINNNGVVKYKNEYTFDAFMFTRLILECKGMFLESSDIFCTLSSNIKYNLFFIINNIINQELPTDNALVHMLTGILSPDKIMDLISAYLRGIYIKYIFDIDYKDHDFEEYFHLLELEEKHYGILLNKFKSHNQIYEDEFFKLSAQMFLYLTILGAKYSMPEAGRIINLDKRELLLHHENVEEELKDDMQQLQQGVFGFLKLFPWDISRKSKFAA